MVQASELPIDEGATAIEMAETIFADDITVLSASYTGDSNSSGVYSNADAVMPGVAPGDTGVIFSTGDVDDVTNSFSSSNQRTNTSTNTSGQNNNADFNAAVGTSTYDAAYLDVDFIPEGDTLTFDFVFLSEEFPEYESAIYQDFVGVWINGELVPLSIGDGDIDPNNLNSDSNANLYVDNTTDAYNTEMDGFTVTMSVTVPVTAGEVNSIRIGIADVSDSNYDSTIMIGAQSGTTKLIAIDDSAQLAPGESTTFDVLANDIDASTGTLTVTHINGIAVSVGNSVTLTTGQVITLNADGTLTATGDNDDEVVNFTYTMENAAGASDTGFITLSQVPCFVAGTVIDTQAGPRLVEKLQPGDMVRTADDGYQPLRWVGQRSVRGQGEHAPIEIAANTFGSHLRLQVSPLHRILVEDAKVDLMFAESAVLISAKYLVNDGTVRRVESSQVTYVHLMFDAHQIIYSNGLASESFLPGPLVGSIFEAEVLAEICDIFPELDPATGDGYGPAVRRVLKGFEARALLGVAA
ncbi:Hint domain-containing protein [Roseivivax sp. CAU 1753]